MLNLKKVAEFKFSNFFMLVTSNKMKVKLKYEAPEHDLCLLVSKKVFKEILFDGYLPYEQNNDIKKILVLCHELGHGLLVTSTD